MKTKHYLFFLIVGLFSTTNAQHIIKPNGDAAAKPNLPKVSKSILTSQSSKDLARTLRAEKSSAIEIFRVLKPTTSDSENINALCSAGFDVWSITDALKADGKTALETVDLLKNSANCHFSRTSVLQSVRSRYGLRLDLMVPIIQAKYVSEKNAVVDCLIEMSPDELDVIDAIGYGGLATNCREVCVLLKGKVSHFNKEHLGHTLQTLMRSHIAGGVDRYFNLADGLMVFEPEPIDILGAFKDTYFGPRADDRTALELAKIGKHLSISRNDVSTFLRSKSYTATQVLDALQTVYGS